MFHEALVDVSISEQRTADKADGGSAQPILT